MNSSHRTIMGLDWDRLGTLASTVCAAHCLAAPLVFLLLPSVADIWAHPSSHALMALAVVPLALTSLFMGYRRHKSRLVLTSASSGILLVLAGSVLPYLPKSSADAVVAGAASCVDCCPTVVVDAMGEHPPLPSSGVRDPAWQLCPGHRSLHQSALLRSVHLTKRPQEVRKPSALLPSRPQTRRPRYDHD